MRFPITIKPGEDGYFIVECPVIPGCVSQGKTEEVALINIQEAIKLCLDVRKEQGLPLLLQNRINIAKKKNKAFEDKYGVKFTTYSSSFPDDATIEQHEDFIEWEFWSQTVKKYTDA